MRSRLKQKQRQKRSRIFFLFCIAIVLLFIAIGNKTLYLISESPMEKLCGPADISTTPLDYPNSTTLDVTLPFSQQGGTIDDASCLNETLVHGIVTVKTEDDIRTALSYAKKHDLKVSIAGMRHSMGGQIAYPGGMVLDMRRFNTIAIDENKKILTAQSGAVWHTIQNELHQKGLAIQSMQSGDIFTVGGSLSVNAHGMDHRTGSIASTIRSLRLMRSDGAIETLSRTQNPELFRLVIGGYGLFGVIVDADIDLTDNVMYERTRTVLPYQDFPRQYELIAAQSAHYGLLYGHLSGAPNSLLKEMILYTYQRTDSPITDIPPLTEVSAVKLRRFFINVAKTGKPGQQLKWWAEKYLEPRFASCATPRTQAMTDGEACLLSRNQAMHDHAPYLRNGMKQDTDILQEYFIPRRNFVPFVDAMRAVFTEHNVTALNAGVRVVHPEDIFLNYATEDMFAFVLYLNQQITPAENKKMATVTRALTDYAIELGGKPYLTYQLYFTNEQLHAAYPMIDQFFARKKLYDPQERFVNKLYSQYRTSI